MPFLQRDYWPCPFCDKGIIEVLIRPSVYKVRRTYGGKGGGKTTWSKLKEEVIIVSKKCKNCGKGAGEIKKKWREDAFI